MSTEAERHEFYEIAKRQVSDRFAELLMKSLPPEPERLATKDDLRVLGADLRTEMAGLRVEMAELRTDLRAEMRDLTTGQTRLLMFGLVGSISAMSATQLIVAAIH